MANMNLGVADCSQGDFSKAIEYHEHRLAKVMEVGDFTRESWAYANLGTSHMYLNESNKAVAYFEAQKAWAADAALNMGVALTIHVRAARQGHPHR